MHKCQAAERIFAATATAAGNLLAAGHTQTRFPAISSCLMQQCNNAGDIVQL